MMHHRKAQSHRATTGKLLNAPDHPIQYMWLESVPLLRQVMLLNIDKNLHLPSRQQATHELVGVDVLFFSRAINICQRTCERKPQPNAEPK